MLMPSTRQPMIWARFSVLNLFMLTIMREGADGKTYHPRGGSILSMAQLNEHAQRLYIDVGLLAESGVAEVGKPLAEVYNALLEQAKKGFPNDRLIGTLEPVAEAMHPRVLQALTGQLGLVLGNS